MVSRVCGRGERVSKVSGFGVGEKVDTGSIRWLRRRNEVPVL